MRTRNGLFITVCIVLALVAVTTVAPAATISGISPASAGRDSTISAAAPGITLRPVAEATAAHVIVTARPLTPRAATVTGISPASADRGSTISAVVSGSGFKPGATVRVSSGRTIVIASGETTLSDSEIRCTLAIPSNAVLGEYELYTQYSPAQDGVNLAWGSEGTAFQVTDGPTITGWDYNCQPRGSAKTHQLGTLNIEPGVQLRLRDDEGTIIEATGETLVGDVGQLRVTLDIPLDADLEFWDVEIRNPGTTAWKRQGTGFRVIPNPAIYSFTPSVAMAGETVTVTVTGRDFISRNGQIVNFDVYGMENVQVPSDVNLLGGDGPNVVTFTVSIPPGSGPLAASFQIINVGDCCLDIPATAVYTYNTFQITQAYSKVTKVSPSQIPRDPANPFVKLYIRGWNFKPGAQVWLYHEGYPIIEGINEQVDSSAATCDVPIFLLTPGGSYWVFVVNPNEPVYLGLENGVTIL